MRTTLFRFSIILLLTSCSHPSKEESAKWVYIEDGACYMERERAKIDYEKGIIKYAVYNYSSSLKTDSVIKSILERYNIEYENLGENCKNDSNCYGIYMLSKIEEKYGEGFINSLITVVKSQVEK
ncbi:MAG: hypothetical protein IPO63_02465 [Bacteroidetes bacterium]|nr:hypothetical protein [Bacteroidota bacterium]